MRALFAAAFGGACLVLGVSAPVRADIGDDIARSCVAEWFLPREVCTCVAEAAVQRFNEVQLRWLALPAGYPNEAAAIAKEMSMSQAQAVGNFIVNQPHQCEAG